MFGKTLIETVMSNNTSVLIYRHKKDANNSSQSKRTIIKFDLLLAGCKSNIGAAPSPHTQTLSPTHILSFRKPLTLERYLFCP